MHRFETISNIDLILQITTTPVATTPEVTTTIPTTPAPVASMILIAGGYLSYQSYLSSAEVLTGGTNQIQLPNLPTETYGQSLINHYGTVLHCGGLDTAFNIQKSCVKLSNSSWVAHSTLNGFRYDSGAATTNSGSFIFGSSSSSSRSSFEYLTPGNTNWQTGTQNIPNGYRSGCVIQISEDLLYLIGGRSSAKADETRILAFNTTSHVFTTLSTTLITGRNYHSCEFIPNSNKVMISGGYNLLYTEYVDTEVLDVTTGTISNGPALNIKRRYHGSGIITIGSEDRLVVFGGYSGSSAENSIEQFNPETNSWQMMSETLTESKYRFGYLTIKEGDI